VTIQPNTTIITATPETTVELPPFWWARVVTDHAARVAA
jgi:hypothetical protein